MSIKVIKADGREQGFDIKKLETGLTRAAIEAEDGYAAVNDIAEKISDILESNNITQIKSSELLNLVKSVLLEEGELKLAEKFIAFSIDRERKREMDSTLMKEYEEITFSSEEDSEIKRENANISSVTAMGTMLKYGSEGAKKFNLLYLIDKNIAEAHKEGWIHIHDLDFYSLTETCLHIPIDKLFGNGGFNTGHGAVREPGNIRTAASLAAICIQANQNDQHGGQSIPLFDWYLAPYVALTYVKLLAKYIKIKFDLSHDEFLKLRKILIEYRDSCSRKLVMNDESYSEMKQLIIDFIEHKENDSDEDKIGLSAEEIAEIDRVFDEVADDVNDEVYQAMEGFIHNMNTLHSRAGSQVPFSSVNFGTDTSTEGRMIIKNELLATQAGMGNGETAIFPISIFKEKAGINFNPGDPNYDLWELACEVSALRLYPNFLNLDAPYNSAIYVEGHPETEMATMGCRTRVSTNHAHPENTVLPGRGNLSFTTINIVRCAIEAKGNKKKFFKLLDYYLELVHKQLLDRFDAQCKKHAINYPFLMGQGAWIDSDKLQPMDDIRDVLKNGTLGVGFIGLAETLTCLMGKHHGESDKAQKLGIEIVSHMRETTDRWSQEEHMNYGLLATPAEGLSGRFVGIDKKKYGIIKGVTDKDYYTNSFHVPVYFNISAYKKVDIEAPYHEICNGGHITYIELDGDPTQNIEAFKRVVRYMHDKNIGYCAINHPLDRDPVCGYVGVINDVCPRCGRRENEPMTIEMWEKINKYAAADNITTCGACGDVNEEADRIVNKA